LAALTASATAQNYPARPVTMVIPFAAGGPTDVLGRVVGAEIVADNQAPPEYLAKLVKDETEKWAVQIKASGVTVE
jgi:hypothetical protein